MKRKIEQTEPVQPFTLHRFVTHNEAGQTVRICLLLGGPAAGD
jgi:hypothetical protein